MYSLVRPVGYVVLLCDTNGVAVEYRGSDARSAQFRYWGVWVGGVWSEAIEGTNGIGTCIAEQRPITVHQTQHFRARHGSLSCSGVHSTGPPRRWGGNIDCKLLVAGTTLFLPIPVDGALLSAGDGHARQGDGEVSGTAIESPFERAQLTLGVRDDLDLRMPIARTADAWVTFGFDEDLDKAATLALETMLDLMEHEHGVSRDHALALASVVVDLHVTQIVNGAQGVHAILRDDAIR